MIKEKLYNDILNYIAKSTNCEYKFYGTDDVRSIINKFLISNDDLMDIVVNNGFERLSDLNGYLDCFKGKLCRIPYEKFRFNMYGIEQSTVANSSISINGDSNSVYSVIGNSNSINPENIVSKMWKLISKWLVWMGIMGT